MVAILERIRIPQEALVDYAAFRLRQLGVRAADADDVAQKVFMGLFRRTADGKMPDLDDRDALRMQGYSVDQIGEMLGIPSRTVDRRIQWIHQLCEEYQQR